MQRLEIHVMLVYDMPKLCARKQNALACLCPRPINAVVMRIVRRQIVT